MRSPSARLRMIPSPAGRIPDRAGLYRAGVESLIRIIVLSQLFQLVEGGVVGGLKVIRRQQRIDRTASRVERDHAIGRCLPPEPQGMPADLAAMLRLVGLKGSAAVIDRDIAAGCRERLAIREVILQGLSRGDAARQPPSRQHGQPAQTTPPM